MEAKEKRDFKDMILNEMKVDYNNILEKNFMLAKKFIRITTSGTIDIIYKGKLSTNEKLLIYLIGKKYAKEAGLTEFADAANNELKNELGMPEGSLLPGIKIIRDKRMIETVKRDGLSYHSILPNLIVKVLNDLELKSK